MRTPCRLEQWQGICGSCSPLSLILNVVVISHILVSNPWIYKAMGFSRRLQEATLPLLSITTLRNAG
jgi:hypothetical protein